MKLPHRFGFTLVELLVVIAIIAVLISLMLPAVQASRETARRSECATNLTQAIVAVQHYQQAHEVYPPGVIDDHGPIHSTPQGKHYNWIVQLLPYLEELPTYKHIDQTAGVYADANAEVRHLTVSSLQCPDELEVDSPYGISSYAACHHDVEAPIDADNHGVFFLNSHLRYEDISDGTAHTIFLGEKIADANDLGWMSGTRATLRNTGTALNEPPRTTTGSSASEEEKTDAGDKAAEKGSSPSSDPTLYVGGFASRHTSGVNFAFGDGSVRFVPDTISQQILQQLGNRADGQLLDAPY